ncbi:hypothetical protein D9619_012432 [Psilocybe cf. subviscida]|uniref:Uncharacterized protein n=1 Tax=Psilocybe cf. subviscida TaxID=2480587 RepID=A0A8H5AR48_9AGAR|nr:hypothetical protein D9619_012432 [Psilocybe cf. subviscida]
MTLERRYQHLKKGIQFMRISFWLWGRIVQLRLDEYLIEQNNHRVRYQKKSLLPSGGRRIDFYNHPEDYGGTNHLIKVDLGEIDALLAKYDRLEYTQFGSDEMFIYAATVMRFISHSSASPTISLARVRGAAQIPANSKSPFSHLDAIYTYILSQVDNQEALKDILHAHTLILDHIPKSMTTQVLEPLPNQPLWTSCNPITPNIPKELCSHVWLN